MSQNLTTRSSLLFPYSRTPRAYLDTLFTLDPMVWCVYSLTLRPASTGPWQEPQPRLIYDQKSPTFLHGSCWSYRDYCVVNSSQHRIGRHDVKHMSVVCLHRTRSSGTLTNEEMLHTRMLNKCLHYKKQKFNLWFRLLVCFGFSSHSRISNWYTDVTITVEWLQILTYTRYSWPVTSEGSIACHLTVTWVSVNNDHLRGLAKLSSGAVTTC